MKRELQFEVLGPPATKGRHRSYISSSGRVGTYTPSATVAWEKAVYASSVQAVLRWRRDAGMSERWIARGAFGLSCEFHLPTRHKKDLSNLIKAIEDGMNGVVYDDDEQIDRYGSMRRFYSAERPRAVVHVWRVDDGQDPLVE